MRTGNERTTRCGDVKLGRVGRGSKGKTELFVTKVGRACFAHKNGERVERSEGAAILKLCLESAIYGRKVREIVAAPRLIEEASFECAGTFTPKDSEANEEGVTYAFDSWREKERGLREGKEGKNGSAQYLSVQGLPRPPLREAVTWRIKGLSCSYRAMMKVAIIEMKIGR